jgi:hypothetical protein
MSTVDGREGKVLLFLGDDWSQEHHDVKLQDEAGRVLVRAKLPEGMAGMARLHAMIGEHVVMKTVMAAMLLCGIRPTRQVCASCRRQR